MKQSCLLLLACLAANQMPTAEPPQRPVFQLRLVVDKPASDSEEVRMRAGPGGKEEMLQVQKTVLMDQASLKSAAVLNDPSTGDPRIAIALTGEGRELFARITRDNLGKRLAIFLNGELVSAPKIAAAVTGGKAEISGHFTGPEAAELAGKLNQAAAGIGRERNP
jgi:preprotein translocase subunit SecD